MESKRSHCECDETEPPKARGWNNAFFIMRQLNALRNAVANTMFVAL